ncbi:MAG: cellulose 1,4-beta-cellobiosidase [Ruminococcus sp.]|nr:cellulose 1,4-beta-cellobiosidase [Ruminococcus sp.]
MISKKNKALTAAVLAATVSVSALLPTMASAASTATEYSKETDRSYAAWFGSLYDDVITNGQTNGYLSQNDNGSGSFGIPYHAVETVICEAPDYGHETTSEAMSYIAWVAAMRDALGAASTNDLSATNDLPKAWKTLEAMIPGWSEAAGTDSMNLKSIWNQPNGLKADTAPELDTPEEYPTSNQGGDAKNPLYNEFKSAYSSDNGYYLMHWLADVDDWYGFGGSRDSLSDQSKWTGGDFVFINTFQRGRQESCFETVPHPCLEELKYGNTSDGIKGIFNGVGNVAAQYAFTNAPDAEDRAIQAVYFANLYGVGDSSITALAGKMGDQLRNDMFDKYYKKIGCQNIWEDSANTANSIKGQHFLRAWYTAWGGDMSSQYSWAWQIGCSHSHEFYQNPLAAYALLADSGLKSGMKSTNAVSDYEESLKRQVEMYLWLQSAEGPIGGGCTNSLNGRYETYPTGTSTFYEMAYVAHPVYADPGSNHWIGNQVWAVQRLAELYYYVKTNGDSLGIQCGGLSLEEALKAILDRWVNWFIENTKFDYVTEDGDTLAYAIPSTLNWGEIGGDDAVFDMNNQPASWDDNGGVYDPNANDNYHCEIAGYGMSDVGCVSSLCNTLIYYAAANKVDGSFANNENGSSVAEKALYTANKLLSTQWDLGRDEIGISFTENNGSLKRLFEQKVWIPTNYRGTMPDGSKLENGATFSSIRESYQYEEKYQELKAAYDSTGSTESVDLNYHRFWHAGDALMAYGAMALLYPEVDPLDPEGETTTDDLPAVTLWGDADCNGVVNINDAAVIMSYVSNKEANPLTPQGLANGDVYQNGDGISNMDALSIQKKLAQLLATLPESTLS